MERNAPLAWFLASLAALAAFCVPAIWNGFPFVFYDSADYIEAAFSFSAPPFRLLPYGYVIAFGRVFDNLWLVVLAQAAANLLALALLARLVAPSRAPGHFLAAALGAALLTAAPWFSGLLMPDAFTGVSILSGVLILLGWRDLGRLRLILLPLAVLSAMVHATHLLILAGLSLLGLLCWKYKLAPRSAALALTAVTAFSWLAVPALQAVSDGEWRYNKGSSVFLLARLVSAGIVQKDLEGLCAEKPYLICAMRDRLTGDENDFLWGHGGVFFGRVGSVDQWLVESSDLVRRTVKAHPYETAGFMLASAARQFAAFGPGDVFDPMSFHMQRAFEQRWPAQVAALQNAKQEHGFTEAKHWLGTVGIAGGVIGLAGSLLLLAVAMREKDHKRALLAALVLAGLAGNALACGGLSSLADRYQARAVWLALALLLVNWSWLKIRIYSRRQPED